ncbi:MAG: flagellar hook-length control protein FliK [Rhodocyclaceae bacterium]
MTALTARLPAGDGKPLADMETTAAMSFAAHFQRFAAKQAGINVATPLPEELAEIADDLGNEPKSPSFFLDALGSAQQHAPASTVPSEEPHSLCATMMVADAGAGTLAVPFAPPSSAANPAAFTDSAAVSPSPLPAGRREPASSVMPDPFIPARNESANVPSAGREFASSLTAAIVAAHETPSPGDTAAVVQQVVAHQSPGQFSSAHEDLTVARPVGTPGWAEDVGNRIAWIASQGRSQAELVLNPPQMGRIEVNLTLNGDQATASFASSNPVVRELLEAALPRLREAFADIGIQLGQAQVGAEHPQHQARQEKHGENPLSDWRHIADATAAISSARSGTASTLAALKSGRGLVDVFA